MNVNEKVQSVFIDFYENKKYIGLSDDSSILALRALDDINLSTEF